MFFFYHFQHPSTTPSPHTHLVTFLNQKYGGSNLGSDQIPSSEPSPLTTRHISILLLSDTHTISYLIICKCELVNLVILKKKKHSEPLSSCIETPKQPHSNILKTTQNPLAAA